MHVHLVTFLIFNIIMLIRISNGRDFQPTDITTAATPTTLQRTTVADSISSETAKEGLTKRNIKVKDLSAANSANSKSYDPPPEFYRGPGSTGPLNSVTTPYYNDNYKLPGGFVSKPIAFPDSNIHNNFVPSLDGGAHLASSYGSWQHLKNKTALFGALLNKTGIQDRISVGHYGNPLHDSRPYSGTHSQIVYTPPGQHYPSPATHQVGGSGGYSYDAHPHPQVEYGHHYSAPSHTAGNYYGGSGSAEGLPFEVYGGVKGQHSGAGGDYAYTYPTDVHDSAAHKTYPDLAQKALLAKSFLIPLASAAVLGIAAALVSNPLLLQLGTVSGVGPAAAFGKRKRRQATSITPPTNDSPATKDPVTHPYRAHHPRVGRT